MSERVLYSLLKRIPDATDEEVNAVVSDVASASQVATKSDIAELKTAAKLDIVELKAELNTKIAHLETRLVKQTYGAAGVVVAAITLLKFL